MPLGALRTLFETDEIRNFCVGEQTFQFALVE